MLMHKLRALVLDERPLDAVLAAARPPVAAILGRVLNGLELTFDDGRILLDTHGPDLTALLRTADHVRATDVGHDITYVVNRNINFTNVCFVGCRFCGFARHRQDSDARTDSVEDVLEKVQEAVERGATEICMQGGINPALDPFVYRDLLAGIKARFPQIHIHAFSPMEILYGARRTGMPYAEYLSMLRDAGLGTIPGTAAEILDDDVREILSHKKVDVRSWVDIVTTAHRVGLRSSSTMMYGHIETHAHIIRHLLLLRSIQKDTGGFTEFVPLRFIHTYTALYQKGMVDPPPKGVTDLRMYAVARLMLRGQIDNVQTSWVKLGRELAQLSFRAGVNDLGGTLMEEQITKSAGGDAGEYLPVADMHAMITAMGRVPVERTTTYGRVSATAAQAPGNGAGWRGGRSALLAGPELAS